MLTQRNAYFDVAALKIHMSENAHYALLAFPGFITESRGDIFIKVKIADYLTNRFLLVLLFYIL